jgi:hypothetical protein
VTAPAPSVCPTCEGEGQLRAVFSETSVAYAWPCPSCQCCPRCGAATGGCVCDECVCGICGQSGDVVSGECGRCHDEADRAAVRRADL